jgi:hypothetical protein
VTTRPAKSGSDLRFKKTGPQTAVTVADAFNNASAQNSKAIANPARTRPSSSVLPTLSRRQTKRRSLPTPTSQASSSVGGSTAGTSSGSVLEPQFIAKIHEELSTFHATQAQQGAEIANLRRARTNGGDASTLDGVAAFDPLRSFPSSSTAPALPRRQTKRRSLPVPTGLASSSTGGPTVSTSSGRVPDQFTPIFEELTALRAEVAVLRQSSFAGANGQDMSAVDSIAALGNSQQSTATVKIMADLVSNLVSAFQPASNPTVRDVTFDPSGTYLCAQLHPFRTYSSTRGRGRGRGGLIFGHHPHPSMPRSNTFSGQKSTPVSIHFTEFKVYRIFATLLPLETLSCAALQSSPCPTTTTAQRRPRNGTILRRTAYLGSGAAWR